MLFRPSIGFGVYWVFFVKYTKDLHKTLSLFKNVLSGASKAVNMGQTHQSRCCRLFSVGEVWALIAPQFHLHEKMGKLILRNWIIMLLLTANYNGTSNADISGQTHIKTAGCKGESRTQKRERHRVEKCVTRGIYWNYRRIRTVNIMRGVPLLPPVETGRHILKSFEVSGIAIF